MSKASEGPWYSNTRNAYCVWINRKLVVLYQGLENKANAKHAMQKWREKMSMVASSDKKDDNTVYAVVLEYLGWVFKNQKPATYAIRQRWCLLFSSNSGSVMVRDLTPFIVEKWAGQWDDGSRRIALHSLLACFGWAVRCGLISVNPLQGKLNIPEENSRMHIDCIPTKEEFRALVVAAKDQQTADLLFALHDTGARPGEVAHVEARHFDTTLKAWVFKGKKPKGRRKKKDRVIYLTDKLVSLTESLSKLYPQGVLFRTKKGLSWDKRRMMMRVRYLRMRLGITKPITPYSFRHKFITEALLAGMNTALVAELVGHKNTNMITNHYSHLIQHPVELRAQLGTFRK